MKRVIVVGGFDDLRSRHIRFLEEAAKLGAVHVLLWPDDMVRASAGVCKFPVAERQYLLGSIHYVDQVSILTDAGALPAADIWAVEEQDDAPAQRALAATYGLEYRVLGPADLASFPAHDFDPAAMPADRQRVMVTGCYDWFHSGHVRFFEEVSQLGDLYVAAGHDANVRLLKGEDHPLFPAAERRYMVQAIRFVTQALISSGHGWMDAEPEIELVRPHIYAVNEDGDKPEKRRFCAEHGLEYVVLKRMPAPGLAARSSSELRGF